MTRPRRDIQTRVDDDGDEFHALVDALPDAVMVVARGTVAYANRAMHRLLGAPTETLVGHRVAEFLARTDRDVIATIAELTDNATAAHRAEIAWRQPTGVLVVTDCAIGQMTWKGRHAVQIVAREAAQRWANEAALRLEGADMARLLAKGRADLTASNARLDAETQLREQAELDRDAVMARLADSSERERRRLSRELHDEVGQRLTSLLLGLQGIIDVAGIGSEVDVRAKTLHGLAQQLGSDLHDVAVRQRPRALDDFGIEAALKSYVALWSRESGIQADVQTTGRQARLPETVETALYRIAQEALTNIGRHAGAKSVSIVLHKANGLCRLAIEDDGKGFDPASMQALDRAPGLGLLGMHERARLLGGRLHIESKPGRGTSVFVQIPSILADPAADEGAPS